MYNSFTITNRQLNSRGRRGNGALCARLGAVYNILQLIMIGAVGQPIGYAIWRLALALALASGAALLMPFSGQGVRTDWVCVSVCVCVCDSLRATTASNEPALPQARSDLDLQLDSDCEWAWWKHSANMYSNLKSKVANYKCCLQYSHSHSHSQSHSHSHSRLQRTCCACAMRFHVLTGCDYVRAKRIWCAAAAVAAACMGGCVCVWVCVCATSSWRSTGC